MAVSVSFVIPVLNEQSHIASVLTVLRKKYPQAELIVVDGGSTDATVRCAMPLSDQLLVSVPGRAQQMNLGAQVATGDYLMFLHADSEPNIASDVLEHSLAQSPLWGFCPVELRGANVSFRVIEWFINHRSRLTSVGTGDQMIYLSRECFTDSGGFDDIPLMEDVALCKRLREVAPPVLLPGKVYTSSRRWEEGGVVKTVLRMWLLRLAYYLGASPQTLWHHYYGE